MCVFWAVFLWVTDTVTLPCRDSDEFGGIGGIGGRLLFLTETMIFGISRFQEGKREIYAHIFARIFAGLTDDRWDCPSIFRIALFSMRTPHGPSAPCASVEHQYRRFTTPQGCAASSVVPIWLFRALCGTTDCSKDNETTR